MTSTPGSATDDGQVVVVTPWYPSERHPVWGVFVRDAVVAMGLHHPARITVVHVDGSAAPEGETRESWVERESRPEADLVVVRVPFSGMVSRAEAMEIHRAALREHASDILARARIVSAHVGGPTAAAVAPLLSRRTRFVITEHATYLKALFDDLSAGLQYRAAMARANRVIAVSDATAAALRWQFPQQAGIVSVVPNPVRFEELPLREQPVRRMRRWLFVGNLVERKGVARLLEAFADEVASGSDDLTLTIVGDGPQRAELVAEAADRGVSERVRFVGAVEPADVPAYYADHDVLVHLADAETFGITVVEAAATGLPVVVTRSGGPQETMVVPAGAGTCAFVDVDPSADAVRAAVASLRTDVTRDELAQVRGVLRGFYGVERVADLLQKYVHGVAVARPLAAPSNTSVVVVFEGSKEWGRLSAAADRAADMGMTVVAVDLASKVTETPAGIAVLGPGDVDRHNTLRSIERGIVERLPRLAIAGAARAGHLLGDGAAPRVERGIAAATSAQRRMAATSERVVYRRAWTNVRDQVIATRVQRQPELRSLDHLDVVVSTGGGSDALAERLVRRNPGAIVHEGTFTAADIAGWWVARHLS